MGHKTGLRTDKNSDKARTGIMAAAIADVAVPSVMGDEEARKQRKSVRSNMKLAQALRPMWPD